MEGVSVHAPEVVPDQVVESGSTIGLLQLRNLGEVWRVLVIVLDKVLKKLVQMLLSNQVTRTQHEDRLCRVVGLEMDLLSRLRIVKPRVIQHLLARGPVVPVFVKAGPKEASGLGAEVPDLWRRQVDIVLLEQPFHIRKILSIEGHASAEKHVDHHRGAPNIYFAVIGPLHEYLRRHVARAAQPLREEALVLRDRLCEPKVGQFDDARLLVDEDVV